MKCSLLLIGVVLSLFVSGQAQKKYDKEESWFERAIIYQITPYIFTDSCKYPDIEAKLPELASLGVNTIYLQPVFKTQRGKQGYDIIDYFSLRDDLGTEKQLASLINKAKSLGFRILFDMVLNHTSIHHPYAKDVANSGRKSRYYYYYQHEFDSVLYSNHYHKDSLGFVYYFWKDLVNLDFNNDSVQKWMLNACKYWVEKYDIDGYRFDAVWGMNARTPSFGKKLEKELKALKPGFLMLAEDKASFADTYRKGFDVAYDWDKSIEWVSKWAWQYEYDAEHKHTIFNHPSVSMRKQLLRRALFSDGDSVGLRLRYMENNDLHRFVSNHSVAETKMAATLLFSLNGIPMLFNGQEVGFKVFPYRAVPIFSRTRSIESGDSLGLFNFYKKLIAVRKNSNALMRGDLREIDVTGGEGVLAFSRNYQEERIVVIINLDSVAAKVSIPEVGLFEDLLSAQGIDLGLPINIAGSTAMILRHKN